MDEYGQWTNGGPDSGSGDWWSGTVNVLTNVWNTASNNKTNQNIAKTNAAAVTSTVKFLGFVIIAGIVVKKLFKL